MRLPKLLSPVYTLFDMPTKHAAYLDKKNIIQNSFVCGAIAFERERTVDDYNEHADFQSRSYNDQLGRKSLIIQRYYFRQKDEWGDDKPIPVFNVFSRLNKDSLQLQYQSFRLGKKQITYQVMQDFPFEYRYEFGDSIQVQNYDYPARNETTYDKKYEDFSARMLFIISADSKKVEKLVVRTGRSWEYLVYEPDKADKSRRKFLHTDESGNKSIYELKEPFKALGRIVIPVQDAKQLLGLRYKLFD